MKRVSISGSLRENVGKKDAKRLRREGKVVCVIYGGKEQKHFAVAENAFNKLIFTPDVYIVDVDIDGEKHTTILQDVQFHPVTDKALHVDFLQIMEGKAVTVELPVKIEGIASGVMKGGILNKKLSRIPVKGLIEDMPENFVIDISEMEINDSVKVGDVDFGKLTAQIPDRLLVVGVKTARGADEEEEEEEGEEGEEGSEEGAKEGAKEGEASDAAPKEGNK